MENPHYLLAALYFVITSCYFSIFGIVIIKEPKSKMRQDYLKSVFWLAVYSLFIGFMTSARSLGIARFFWSAGFISGCIFYPCWLLFLLNMVEIKYSKILKIIFHAFFYITLFITLACIFSDDITFTFKRIGTQYNFRGNPILAVAVINNIILIVAASFMHIMWMRQSKIKRIRRQLLLFNILICLALPGFLTDFIIPLLKDFTVIPIASFLIFPASMYVFYTMRKNQQLGFSVANVSGYVFKSITIPALALNYKNEICLENKAALDFFGGSLMGKNIGSVVLLDEKDAPPSNNLSLFDNEFENKYVTTITPSGKKACDMILTLEKNKYGDSLCKVLMLRDLTETQETSIKLEAALRQANAANLSKSRFLTTMSHEIRTPMNAIIGVSQIQLQNENLSDEHIEAMEKIYNSGSILLGIINDILDLSKIETGNMEIVSAEYDMPSLINDTVQLTVFQIGSKPVEFKLDIDENLPSRLIGDELRVKQILNNLLSNAIKYTEKGHISLKVHHTKEDQNITLYFIVEDTGQGIKAENLEGLFSEQPHVNTEAGNFSEGTGIGLNIAKNLIDLMDGTIKAESEYGKGSVFTVMIKQKPVECKPIGKELAQTMCNFKYAGMKQYANLKILRQPMPYGKVLVVDDVETNLFVAEGLLSPYKLKIETAVSGYAAIEKIEKGSKYDIIFMDHMMPQMDGIETTQKIRLLGYTGSIIALTANAIADNDNMFSENGFDGFIPKPIDIRHLNSALNKFVRDRHPEEAKEYRTEKEEDVCEDRFYRR